MVRIWAKVMKNEKIVQQLIYENPKSFSIDDYYSYVSSICNDLDIATPIVLSKHIFHFMAFNNSVFLPNDFPEDVNFDKLVLEEATIK